MKKFSFVFVVYLSFSFVFASELTFGPIDDEDDEISFSGSGDFELSLPVIHIVQYATNTKVRKNETTSEPADATGYILKALSSALSTLDKRIKAFENIIRGHQTTIKELKRRIRIRDANIVTLISKIKVLDERTLALEMNSTYQNITIKELENTNKVQDEIMVQLKNKNREEDKKIDRNNYQMVRNILVFTGVPEVEGKGYVDLLRTVVIGVLNQEMNQMIEFEEIGDVRRDDSEEVLRSLDEADEETDLLRNRSNKGLHPRPIVVRFVNHLTKLRVLQAKANLKNTTKVSDVYSKYINQRRKALTPFLKKKIEQGHKAVLVEDKLELDGGQIMTLEQLEAGSQSQRRAVFFRKRKESSGTLNTPTNTN